MRWVVGQVVLLPRLTVECRSMLSLPPLNPLVSSHSLDRCLFLLRGKYVELRDSGEDWMLIDQLEHSLGYQMGAKHSTSTIYRPCGSSH